MKKSAKPPAEDTSTPRSTMPKKRTHKPKASVATVVGVSPPDIQKAENNTPLRIPFGNKEVAQKLGARYGAGGWYAPPGVNLHPFSKQGWL